ncbi:hypothetical protein [Kingella potus]|uniref:hypothetical protein n=1 Tax=Kingella potus TaxID=265175 RepID=UPI00155949C8|nr:hypothetical protein [Kingella potus]UOP01059.1 hypothetical protein LVJ84_01425 [Kingella potus]
MNKQSRGRLKTIFSDGLFTTKTACVAWGDTPYTGRRGKTDRPSEKPDFVFRRPLPLR